MSVANRRKREKAERRRAILGAAERVFFSKGFAASTMEEVAAEAELSKGTLYLYFKNKDELFLELSTGVLGTIVERFEALGESDSPGLDIVGSMLRAYAEQALCNPDHFRVLVGWMASGYQIDTETPGFARHRGLVARLIAALVGAIRKGQADGSVRGELDPSLTAAQLWGGTFGIIQVQINREEVVQRFHEDLDFSSFIDGHVDLVCRGISC